MRRGIASAVLLAAVLAYRPVAAAQDEPEVAAEGEVDVHDAEARSLFDAGSLAFEQGRYEEALERFVRAHELSGRAALLYNIGTTHDRLRNDAEALEAFERYLEAEPDSARRAEIEARIAVLRDQVARAAAVPTPEETARSVPPDTGGAGPIDEESGSTWWIWATAGVLLAGAVVVAVLLLAGGGTQDAIPGDEGMVWSTLRSGP